MTAWEMLQGNCLTVLPTLAAGSVQTCITSPPYFGLRSYLKKVDPGKSLEIGSETLPKYIENLVLVAREVWRVLRDDGTFWLNIGDSYTASPGQRKETDKAGPKQQSNGGSVGAPSRSISGIPAKNLCLVPQRLVIALQESGWCIRSVIRWFKVSPMPESVRDRPTSAVEEIFLLTKSAEYFYDQEAERVPHCDASLARVGQNDGHPKWDGERARDFPGSPQTLNINQALSPGGRNLWNWWEVTEEGSGSWFIPNEPLKVAHFAAFPSELARRCISLSTSAHGCCPSCGAPWRRVTSREQVKRERPNEYVKRTGEEGTGNSCGNTVAGVSVQTVGWQPTCKCGREDVQPCRVLDPFAGAGTTLLAAVRAGRCATGIELNADYCDMARRRIVGDNPLFNGAAS